MDERTQPMYNPLIPNCEEERLRALYSYEILDTPTDPKFDQIVNLATRVFQVPIALVSFVDCHRQWFKAGCGLDITETSREIAFCAHTILAADVLQIEDTWKDARFAENPLVKGPPFIRFYAGAPLCTSQGFNLGTLCLIDMQPRSLDSQEKRILADLAAMVVKEVDLHFEMRKMEMQALQHRHLVTERDQMINSLSSVLIGLNEDLTVSYWNRAAEQIFQKSSVSMLGKPFHQCNLRWNWECILAGLDLCRSSGQSIRLEDIHFYRQENDPRILGISINSIQSVEGSASGFILLAADITEKRESEAALATAVKDLEILNVHLVEARDAALAADEMKTQFLSNTSHELRTPLNGVMGMAGLLLETKIDALQRHYIRTIKQSAGSLLTIINDILDFSKSQAGKMRLEVAPISLFDILEEAATLLAPKAFEKNLDFCCDLPPLTGSLSSAERLEGDSTRIRQIVLNLLGNAIKFTSAGEVVLGAELLSESVCEAQWRLYVRDTGIGIPQEKRYAIFESFIQVDGSTTRRFGGTGLGLTICRQLAVLMGGKIGVSSEIGKGSLFWVELTLKKQAAFTDTEDAGLPQLLDGLHVLVADANVTQRLSLYRLLTVWGCSVSEAGNESETLCMLQKMTDPNRRQIVLMDGCMPCSDSEQFLYHIQRSLQGSNIDMVTLTSPGKANPPVRIAVPGGAAILKPIGRRELLNCLLSLVKPETAKNSGLSSQEEAPHAPGSIESSARILLAEDNPINQMIAQSLLVRCGISASSISIVSNGQEMLDFLENNPCDLILTDIQMPEMDGITAVEILREQERKHKRVPIVAITAHIQADKLKGFLASGVDDYICQPLEWMKLYEILVQWLPPTLSAFMPGPGQGQKNRDRAAVSAVSGKEDLPITWDQERLRKVTGGDKAVEQRLLGELRMTMPKMLQRCRFAVEMADDSAIEHIAHTMKGSCSTLGILHMAQICQSLENCGREGSFSVTNELLAELECEWMKAQACLPAGSSVGSN